MTEWLQPCSPRPNRSASVLLNDPSDAQQEFGSGQRELRVTPRYSAWGVRVWAEPHAVPACGFLAVYHAAHEVPSRPVGV